MRQLCRLSFSVPAPAPWWLRASRVVAGAVLMLAPMVPAAQAAPTLAQASAYLNGLGTVRGGFVQLSEDGSTSLGEVIIRQPGRARFEYAPPNAALVLIGAGQIAIFDDRSNEAPQVFPLGSTPLSLLLGNRIDLETSRFVAGQREEDGRLIVVGQDPDRPDEGRIEMVFADRPVALEGWRIVNAAGETTEVVLDPLTPAADVSVFDFDIDTELDRRGLRPRD